MAVRLVEAASAGLGEVHSDDRCVARFLESGHGYLPSALAGVVVWQGAKPAYRMRAAQTSVVYRGLAVADELVAALLAEDAKQGAGRVRAARRAAPWEKQVEPLAQAYWVREQPVASRPLAARRAQMVLLLPAVPLRVQKVAQAARQPV